MAHIGIFKCDICGKEVRLDRTPHIERGPVSVDTEHFTGLGSLAYKDSCADCAVAVYYGAQEIVEKLRKKVSEA